MLALMADVRMGHIRVPPEMQYRDVDNSLRFAWPWQITPHLSTSGVDVVEVDKKAVSEVEVGPDGEEILPVETIDDDDDDATASVDAMK